MHNDGVHGLNCLYDGQKTFHLMDYKSTKDAIMNEANSWNNAHFLLDVENVDTEKYPAFKTAPHFECKMEAGDCIYVPMDMWHQVNSAKGR